MRLVTFTLTNVLTRCLGLGHYSRLFEFQSKALRQTYTYIKRGGEASMSEERSFMGRIALTQTVEVHP